MPSQQQDRAVAPSRGLEALHGNVYCQRMAKRRAVWDRDGVRALRRHLGVSQEEMAQQMGTRQQTISEWETGMYQPRGMSERLLTMVAEQSGFYGASIADSEAGEHGDQAPPGMAG